MGERPEMTHIMEKEKRDSDPHRFRWLVLGCILAVPVLIVLTVILALIFKIPDKMLRDNLDAQREAAHARGEATNLEDFNLKELPDNENAAVVYNNAYTLFKNKMPAGIDFKKSPIWDRYIASKTYEKPRETSKGQEEDTPSGPLTQDEEKLVETLVTSNDDAYKAICDAGKIPACQFGDYSDPSAAHKVLFDDTFFSKMDSVRPLARAIALRAVWEARHGNTEAAYEWIMQGFHLAKALRTDPTIMTSLQCNAVLTTLWASLNTIMCETQWTGTLPEGFEQELEQFKDRRVFARYLEGDRFFTDVSIISEWGKFPHVLVLSMQYTLYKVNSDLILAVQEADPVKRRELTLAIDRYVSCDGSLNTDFSKNTEMKQNKTKGLKQKFQLISHSHKMMAFMLAPAYFRTVTAFDRLEAQILITQQTLALKRYKQAHGQYPDKLQQLVSAGLDSLPLDPFSGVPFHYKKEGDGFRLYSIGQDRIDDGGSLSLKIKGDVTWLVTQ